MNHWLLPVASTPISAGRPPACGVEHLASPEACTSFCSPRFPSLRVQPRHLLPAGMEITSYNHHAKAPSSQEPWSSTQDYRVRSSLRSYPINFSRFSRSGLLTVCSGLLSSQLDGARGHRRRHARASSLLPCGTLCDVTTALETCISSLAVVIGGSRCSALRAAGICFRPCWSRCANAISSSSRVTWSCPSTFTFCSANRK